MDNSEEHMETEIDPTQLLEVKSSKLFNVLTINKFFFVRLVLFMMKVMEVRFSTTEEEI